MRESKIASIVRERNRAKLKIKVLDTLDDNKELSIKDKLVVLTEIVHRHLLHEKV
jgi:hypothetical protein